MPQKIKKVSKTSNQIYMKITTKIPTQGIQNKRFSFTVFNTHKDKIVIQHMQALKQCLQNPEVT